MLALLIPMARKRGLIGLVAARCIGALSGCSALGLCFELKIHLLIFIGAALGLSLAAGGCIRGHDLRYVAALVKANIQQAPQNAHGIVAQEIAYLLASAGRLRLSSGLQVISLGGAALVIQCVACSRSGGHSLWIPLAGRAGWRWIGRWAGRKRRRSVEFIGGGPRAHAPKVE